MLTIGFATEYYTLWDVTTEPNYITDAYGNHHHASNTTRYSFIKNISKDLEQAKAAHPGTPVNEELRGKTRTWSRDSEDLCPEILKFGKYYKCNIYELVKTDLNYILWLSSNANAALRALCMELPEVVAHLASIENERQNDIAALPVIESGTNEVTFRSNPNHTLGYDKYNFSAFNIEGLESKYYASATIGDGNTIIVLFDSVAPVNGLYPYNMGIINGKAMRLKGKTVKLNLDVLETHLFIGNAMQIATIH